MGNLVGESDTFEVDVDSVRQIPDHGETLDASSVQEGARYECWYAQEGEYYNATVNIVIEYSTAVVLFDGFEDQEEVPRLHTPFVCYQRQSSNGDGSALEMETVTCC